MKIVASGEGQMWKIGNHDLENEAKVQSHEISIGLISGNSQFRIEVFGIPNLAYEQL